MSNNPFQKGQLRHKRTGEITSTNAGEEVWGVSNYSTIAKETNISKPDSTWTRYGRRNRTLMPVGKIIQLQKVKKAREALEEGRTVKGMIRCWMNKGCITH